MDPARLGSGGYRHQLANRLCIDHGDQHPSNKLSRPRHDGKDGIPRGEGFYLNLPNNLRSGHGTRAPAYYEYFAHQYVTYWFFYAHNDAPTALFDHEGDWERISVQLDKANRATAVAYHQHKGYCTRSWQEAGKHEGHPLAYSALGTHATYPWLGAYEIAGGLAFDRTGRDAGWATYGNLTKARDHGWFGFGGAWGEVGEASDTTGPLGPGAPTKDSASTDWNRPCERPEFLTKG
ncbi:hypothetical protein [Nonomuraea fuscirosea]|uniref:hypothetical protein n=1 Tax=Nonomuraea fuscirosea TaxID=1291556 RepID=UPI003440BDAC